MIFHSRKAERWNNKFISFNLKKKKLKQFFNGNHLFYHLQTIKNNLKTWTWKLFMHKSKHSLHFNCRISFFTLVVTFRFFFFLSFNLIIISLSIINFCVENVFFLPWSLFVSIVVLDRTSQRIKTHVCIIIHR